MAAVWAVAAVALVTTPGPARAADAEPVTVTVGKMEVINTAFPIVGFRMADPSVAKVEQQGQQQLRVMGLRAGTTDLQVTGEGNVSAIFALTVTDNINAVLAAVKRDLDTVPEVDVAINLGRVLIKGEVSNIEHWNYLQKVVALYKDSVVNLASFRPAPEVMLGLKAAFEKAGVKVLDAEAPAESAVPGSVKLAFSGNNIFVSGQVYSQRDKDRILQIIEAQNWITLKQKTEEKQGAAKPANEGAVQALVDLAIVPTMIEMEAVFVGVTDAEEKQIGVNLAKAGLLVLDSTSAGFQGDLGTRSSGWAGNYTINSGLQGALKFFAGNGPGRFQNAGHMTFKNDSPEWRTYHSGGTLKVRVATRDATSLEDVDYGLIMKVKGGLMNAKAAALDVNLELSYPVPVGNDYDLKRNRIETTVNCPIGQTIVLAGMKSLVEQSSMEGVPFLRSVPAISWFFSEKNTRKEDSKVLILMSPRIAGMPIETAPVSEQTAPTLQESDKPVQQRQLEKQKRRFFFF
ncbi:MAG: pilus assembly protein N-terminal domain-containing protein [Kiritimatiellia bacterium]|jgi:Flp pilus assembly secretin CpaC|nr:pilus assembly protein N-terminal domain-containing protein [Kiritimatiellia bacterium]